LRGCTKKPRKFLADTIKNLDKLAESTSLNGEDIDLLYNCRYQLNIITREEETKWLQRSKEKELLEGDSNSKGI
jgi:hypothetical protein